MSDPVSPDYYRFPSGVQVIDISEWLTGNGAQIVQYVSRATRTDGVVKGEPVEDLRKAALLLGDIGGEYGDPEVYIEWGLDDDTAILREHRYPDIDGGPDYKSCTHYVATVESLTPAEALHAAGLLAPAPLREEWGARWQPDDQGEDIWDHYLSRSDAERGAGDEGEAVRRYLSDWEPADRAEDDGSADT